MYILMAGLWRAGKERVVLKFMNACSREPELTGQMNRSPAAEEIRSETAGRKALRAADDYDAHQARTRTRWFVLGHDEAAADLLQGGGRVLDAGCATGSLSRVLSRRNVPSVGVDISLERLAVAHQDGQMGSFVGVDLTQMPFAAETFCRIAALRVLQHMAPRVRLATMEELARVARPGGLLLVSVYNALQAHTFGMRRGKGHFRSGIRYHTFEAGELEGELAASGWQVEKVSGYGVILAAMRRIRGGLRLYKALASVLWHLERWIAVNGGRRAARKGQYLFALARKTGSYSGESPP